MFCKASISLHILRPSIKHNLIFNPYRIYLLISVDLVNIAKHLYVTFEVLHNLAVPHSKSLGILSLIHAINIIFQENERFNCKSYQTLCTSKTHMSFLQFYGRQGT